MADRRWKIADGSQLPCKKPPEKTAIFHLPSSIFRLNIMKKNIWLVLAVSVSGNLFAQQVTNAPPAPAIAAPAATNAPAAATSTPASTNAPATKAGKKTTPKKKAEKKAPAPKKTVTELRTVPLVAGQATVVASNVNVRAQAKLKSEVITQVQKGQNLNVLEEVTLKNSGPSEPSAWAKIVLPANIHVWVNTSFLTTNKTVIPKKLSLRAGPGENYSRIGIIKQGDEVKEVGRKGDWVEIEAPAEAFGFVAAQYLKQDTNAPVVPTEPPPAAAVVTENPPVAPATNEPAATEPTNVPPAAEVATTPPPPTPETNAVPEEPPPPRIVDRDGFVRGTFSIQAPTKFELVSPDTGKVMNYLYSTSPELDLRRYKGLRIVVTGEEGLDERWRNTPVITIQKIQVLE
jgi:uncharacterized protein YgiM (DUF1202 family)